MVYVKKIWTEFSFAWCELFFGAFAWLIYEFMGFQRGQDVVWLILVIEQVWMLRFEQLELEKPEFLHQDTFMFLRVCGWVESAFPENYFLYFSLFGLGRIWEGKMWADFIFTRVENNFLSWGKGSRTFCYDKRFNPSHLTKTLFLSLQPWREYLTH